jgi:UDP-glucose 4-epimerase
MFVSLDTMRDYIYTDDAARVIHSKISRAMNHPQPAHSTSIIASGQATSLGYLINMMQDVAHTKIPVAYGNHASAGAQARDLRLVPDDLDLTERLVKTTLSAGVKNVYLDILNRYQVASSGR